MCARRSPEVSPVRLTLERLAKEYGETTALRDVDVDVADGEFFTLVGPSGCGKTTTLRLVAGFESPTAGRVRFDGEDVRGVPPEDRDVGVVFQSYALFPHMTVGENVAYGLRFSEPPGDVTREERVAELLDLVDLEGMADRDPEELSGGQQQRVSLARALAPGPKLLLLDEPMSALDAQLRERLRVQVREIQSELGITTLYVTHDQEEALAISDRVAVMNDGAVEQIDTPQAVYREPATRFVAEFVGDNNVFEGRVDETEVNADGHETEGLHVAVNGHRFRLSRGSLADGSRGRDASGRERADPATGESITFCVRPERLRVGGESNRFSASVESSEFLGESTRVRLDWEGRTVTLRTDDPPETGAAIDLGFDPDDVHVLPDGGPDPRREEAEGGERRRREG